MMGEVIWVDGVVCADTGEPVPDAWADRVTRQTFSISAATREVEGVLEARGNQDLPRVREVHPEVCFRLLGEKRVIEFGKQTMEGQQERIEA